MRQALHNAPCTTGVHEVSCTQSCCELETCVVQGGVGVLDALSCVTQRRSGKFPCHSDIITNLFKSDGFLCCVHCSQSRDDTLKALALEAEGFVGSLGRNSLAQGGPRDSIS